MSLVARFLVAAALLGAGILKAADPTPVVPDWQQSFAVVLPLVPWIEILAGLLLLSELPLRWSVIPATVLCCGFLAVSALRLAVAGVSPDCGCFGVLARPLDGVHLAGVGVLVALCGWLCWRAWRETIPGS